MTGEKLIEEYVALAQELRDEELPSPVVRRLAEFGAHLSQVLQDEEVTEAGIMILTAHNTPRRGRGHVVGAARQ